MLAETCKIMIGVLLPNLTGIKVHSMKKNKISEVQELKFLKQPAIGIPWSVEKYIWPALSSSIGYASYLVYKEGGGFKGSAGFPLLAYSLHLAVNTFWTNEPLRWSIFQMFICTSTAAFAGCQFFDVSRTAGYIFLPYVSWLTYYIYYLLFLQRINLH